MERRTFLTLVGVGAVTTQVPVLLTACNTDEDNTTNSASKDENQQNSTVSSISLGTVTDLNENGFLQNKDNHIIVVRNAQQQLVAFDSRCTHSGCDVAWDKEKNNLLCPCHASQFALDGTVVKGIAKKPLPTYSVQEENGQVKVIL